MQMPPSLEHAVPAAQDLPALGWLTQHCVATVMHVLPQATWPEGQAAQAGEAWQGAPPSAGNTQTSTDADAARATSWLQLQLLRIPSTTFALLKLQAYCRPRRWRHRRRASCT